MLLCHFRTNHIIETLTYTSVAVRFRRLAMGHSTHLSPWPKTHQGCWTVWHSLISIMDHCCALGLHWFSAQVYHVNCVCVQWRGHSGCPSLSDKGKTRSTLKLTGRLKAYKETVTTEGIKNASLIISLFFFLAPRSSISLIQRCLIEWKICNFQCCKILLTTIKLYKSSSPMFRECLKKRCASHD